MNIKLLDRGARTYKKTTKNVIVKLSSPKLRSLDNAEFEEGFILTLASILGKIEFDESHCKSADMTTPQTTTISHSSS